MASRAAEEPAIVAGLLWARHGILPYAVDFA